MVHARTVSRLLLVLVAVAGAVKVDWGKKKYESRLKTYSNMPVVRSYETKRANDRSGYTSAQEYNAYKIPCWDNITMVRLQLAIDGTDGGPQRTKDTLDGKYKNLTGCWDPVMMFNQTMTHQQNSMIFKHESDNKCAISFSGIIGGKHTRESIAKSMLSSIGHTKFCGYQIWTPFIDQFVVHTNHTDFRKMMHYAASPACSGGVKVTGVSRGGIFASLLAACAMEGSLHELGDGMPESFPLDGLWSYGTPGITAVEPIHNKSHPDGCLNGMRTTFGDPDINIFRGEFDPLPWVGNLGQLGPQMNFHEFYFPQTGLTELVDTRHGLESRHWSCTAPDTLSRPKDPLVVGELLGTVLSHLVTGHMLQVTHECRHYIDSMEFMGNINSHRCPNGARKLIAVYVSTLKDSMTKQLSGCL